MIISCYVVQKKKRHPFNFCEINIQQLLYVIVQSLFWNETIRME